MRRALLGSFVVVLVTLPFLAQTEAWKQHKNSTGNFTVLFPVDPQDSVNKKDAEIQSHTLMAVDKPFYYTVIYTTMSSEQKVDDATYEEFKNAVFKELPNCAVIAQYSATPGLAGFIGHWYRLNCDLTPNKVTIVGNLYWGKHYAYAVMVMFPSSTAEKLPSTDKFLNSFALLQPGQ